MFETSLDVPVDVVEMLTAIGVSAVLIVVVAGFCGGTLSVSPSDLNLGRFGGI